MQDALSVSPRHVFFLRTTNESRLSSLEECAVRSAALKNPGWRINVFSNSLHCGTLKGSLSNVHVVRYSVGEVVAAYPPLVDWYASRVWDVPFRGAHISDGMRLALLHAYGGVYLDTDVLSLRPLHGLRNAAGAEDEWMLNNAVLSFERGHPFLAQAVQTFPRTFDPHYWGWNGPRLFTRVWKAYLAPPGHDNVLSVPSSEYYPLAWQQAKLLVARAADHPSLVSYIFSHARMMHAWYHITREHVESVKARGPPATRAGRGASPPLGVTGDGDPPLIVDLLMAAACPAQDDRGSAEDEDSFARAAGVRVRMHRESDAPDNRAIPIVSVQGLGDFRLTLDERPSSSDSRETGVFTVDPMGGLGDPLPSQDPSIAPPGAALLPRLFTAAGAMSPIVFGDDSEGLQGVELSECGRLPAPAAAFAPSSILRLPVSRSTVSAAGALPAQQFTLSMWIATLADEVTLRPLSQALPPVDELVPPPQRGIRAKRIAVPLDTVRQAGLWPGSNVSHIIDSVQEGLAVFGNALVIAIEDGHVAAGSLEGELVRSEQPINDGQWHHVALVFSAAVLHPLGLHDPASNGGSTDNGTRAVDDFDGGGLIGVRPRLVVNTSLFIDGLMHSHSTFSQRARRRVSAADTVWLGPEASDAPSTASEARRILMRHITLGELPRAAPGGSAGAHLPPRWVVDGVTLFPAALGQSDLLRLRNHQLMVGNAVKSSPFAQGPVVPASRAPAFKLSPRGLHLSHLVDSSVDALPQIDAEKGGRVIGGDIRLRVLILVLSDGQLDSVARRHACRGTWLQLGPYAGSKDAEPVAQRHLFIVPGANRTALAAESASYRDLLFVDAPDGYSQVTNKVLLALAAAAQIRRDGSFPFDVLVKTDHDVFLRLDTIHAEFLALSAATGSEGSNALSRFWWGFAYDSMPPLRDYSDRNADLTIPLDAFPPYTAGVMYALGWRLVEGIAQLPSHAISMNEDQSVGLWLDSLNAANSGKSDWTPVRPKHDLRIQQWDVCSDDQLAVHPAPPAAMRSLHANVRTGAPMCRGLGYHTCGLCYPCSMGEWSWFACDPERGASLPEYLPAREVAHLPLAALQSFPDAGSPLESADSTSAFGVIWWALPAARVPALLAPLVESNDRNVAVTAAPRGASDGYLTACRWPGHAWSPAYEGALSSVTDAHGRESASAAVGCQPACSRGRGAAPLRCAASTVFVPPSATDDCNATYSSAHKSAYASSPGQSQRCHTAVGPGVSLMTSVQRRVRALLHNVRALTQAVFSADGPCAQSSDASSGSAGPQDVGGAPQPHELRSPWLLFSATVDTEGACILVDSATGDAVTPGSAPVSGAKDWGYRRYPRFGAFELFCGAFIDVRHSDGHVSTFRSSFARNASAHAHTEVLYVGHPAPVRDIRVTVFNNGPGSRPSLRLSGLSVLPLPVHPGWMPQQRVLQVEAATAKLHAGWADPRMPFRGVLLPLRLLDPDFLPTLYLSCPLRDASGLVLLLTLAAAPLVLLLLGMGLFIVLLRWRAGKLSLLRRSTSNGDFLLETPRSSGLSLGFRLGAGGATPTAYVESPRAWPTQHAVGTPRRQPAAAAVAGGILASSPMFIQRLLWRTRLAFARLTTACGVYSAGPLSGDAPLSARGPPPHSARSRLVAGTSGTPASDNAAQPAAAASSSGVAAFAAPPALGRRKAFGALNASGGSSFYLDQLAAGSSSSLSTPSHGSGTTPRLAGFTMNSPRSVAGSLAGASAGVSAASLSSGEPLQLEQMPAMTSARNKTV